jgi:hypothetical protein
MIAHICDPSYEGVISRRIIPWDWPWTKKKKDIIHKWTKAKKGQEHRSTFQSIQLEV